MTLSKLKTLALLLPVLLLVLAASACGGGGSPKVDSSDVAVVGSDHITVEQFNELLSEQKASMKAQGQTFPAAGSTEYSTLRSNIVNLLVQQAELQQEAQKLGITVSAADIAKELTSLKKQYYSGSDAKYQADLKKQGVTDAQVRTQLQQKLLEEKLYNKVTSTTTPTQAEIEAYYAANQSQFQTAAQRAVQEILVGKNKEALATQLYDQLQNGADFATLAKKYSQDPGSKNQGGHFTAVKGSDVPEFDAAVFDPASKTNVLLKPVNTSQYGWFLIKPVAAIVPARTKTEKEAEPTIKQTLEQQQQQSLASTWMNTVTKSFCSGKISYGTGYTPSPDPCAAINTPNQTTT
jgi:parvulin-like peptidyl-prolyl isomerase